MKKFLLILLFSHLTASANSLAPLYAMITSYFKPKATEIAQPCPKEPRIAILYINNDVNFVKTASNIIAITADQDVDGILLIINNTGGDAAEFGVIHDLLKNLAASKPVVCLITASALSGGYMISSPAHHIIAHSFSDIGSIGAFCLIERQTLRKCTQNGYEKDATNELFQAGDYKTIAYPYGKPLSDEDRNYIQQGLDESYQLFVNLVAENRKLNPEDHKIWANGKIFNSGESALKMGLIDQVGTYFDAITKMRLLIQEKNPEVVYASGHTLYFYEGNKLT